MNKLLLKRNYKLIVIFALVILISVIFSGTRMISYNFGKYETELYGTGYNYTNTGKILDDSYFHQISIDITDEQYNYMLTSYKENSEKEFVKVNITIDGKLIKNVGLRFKGDIDLLEILTGNEKFSKIAFLVKFDEYVEGQTYENLSEIALRVDNDDSMLGQLISFNLLRKLGFYAPKAGYTSLTFGDYGTYDYIVSEAIDEKYVTENFKEDGVLYKASNSLSFSYLGDDPTLYTDLFSQETKVNNYDLKLLINILKFVSTSTDKEFENNLENYIDLDSYLGFMAMDELLGRKDKLLALLNSYYIYVNIETGKASFISRDQKMSFGNTNTPIYEILLKYYTNSELNNLDNIASLLQFIQRGVKPGSKPDRTYENDLERRILQNEKFNKLYKEKLSELKQKIYGDDLALDSLNYYKNVFLSYVNYTNFMTYTDYESIVTTIKNYITNFTGIENGSGTSSGTGTGNVLN